MNAVLNVMVAGAVLSQLDIPSCDGCFALGDLDVGLKAPNDVHGTLEWPPTPVALRTLMVRATAYSYTGSRTATGTTPQWGTVAVDPSVIPLGSRLQIAGFDGVTFVAEDTGGGVRGNWVDIFFPSVADAVRFGSQTRMVTILR
jgi:3D (Asp-Asp-Asp) domain-containing protein